MASGAVFSGIRRTLAGACTAASPLATIARHLPSTSPPPPAAAPLRTLPCGAPVRWQGRASAAGRFRRSAPPSPVSPVLPLPASPATIPAPPPLESSPSPAVDSAAEKWHLPAGTVRGIEAYPAPVLRAKAAPITDFEDAGVRAVFADLLATVTAHGGGIGLAAPQIGASVRAFVVRRPLYRNDYELRAAARVRGRSTGRREGGSGGAHPEFIVCANPAILAKSEAAELGIEACLSVPECQVLVRRALRIDVQYQAPDGSVVREQLHGLPAVVFQHELDHLDGALCVDREVTVVPRGSLEEAHATAQERWFLDIMKYYGEQSPAPPERPSRRLR